MRTKCSISWRFCCRAGIGRVRCFSDQYGWMLPTWVLCGNSMTNPNPYESPAAPFANPPRPAGLILPAFLCLLFCILAMTTGRVCFWAIDYRLENTPFMAKLPSPSIPLWIVDCIWIPSLIGTCLFTCLSFASAYRTIQRFANPGGVSQSHNSASSDNATTYGC